MLKKFTNSENLFTSLLPYSPKLKYGLGYSIDDNVPRASPFISGILYGAEPESIEG